jgi:DNA-binding transcriptional MerR regulator
MAPLRSLSPNAPARFVSITDLAKRVGTTARALRHYQDRGLIRSHRLARNVRAYDLETVAIVETIVAFRDVGLPISTIGEILSLGSTPLAQAKDTRAALKQARAVDEQRIARIDAMLKGLAEPSGSLFAAAPRVVSPPRPISFDQVLGNSDRMKGVSG